MRVLNKSDMFFSISQVWLMGAIGFNNGIMLVISVLWIILAVASFYTGD